jgi:hypothetical protein
VSWLRRWDRRNADWANRTNDDWANAPKLDGMPVEQPDPIRGAYVRFHMARFVVVGVGSVVAVIALLVRYPAYLVGAGLAVIVAAAVMFTVSRY